MLRSFLEVVPRTSVCHVCMSKGFQPFLKRSEEVKAYPTVELQKPQVEVDVVC